MGFKLKAVMGAQLQGHRLFHYAEAPGGQSIPARLLASRPHVPHQKPHSGPRAPHCFGVEVLGRGGDQEDGGCAG